MRCMCSLMWDSTLLCCHDALEDTACRRTAESGLRGASAPGSYHQMMFAHLYHMLFLHLVQIGRIDGPTEYIP